MDYVQVLVRSSTGIASCDSIISSTASAANVAGDFVADGDIECTDLALGLVLKSPDGTRWRIQVDNSGNLTATSI